MRRAVSPGTGRCYSLTMICAVFRVPRSTVYLAMAPAPGGPVVAAKRGPKTAVGDAELVEAIRGVLAVTPFHGRVSQGAGAPGVPGPRRRWQACPAADAGPSVA